MNAGLMGVQTGNTHYNGGGWISYLQSLLLDDRNIELGLAFLSPINMPEKVEKGNTTYFPIKSEDKSRFGKLIHYYGGYKKHNRDLYVKELLHIINIFQPDIIHLFGIENTLARIVGKTKVPMVVHLQGLLPPIANAFWPVGFNRHSLLHRFPLNERIMRNGYIYAKNACTYNAKMEMELFHLLKFAMGRTEWDSQILRILSPDCKYYHVNEVLRDVFYDCMGTWKGFQNTSIKIISTLSNTMYKGLDLVLKTAALLKENSTIKFEWNVVGLNDNHRIVRFFEKELNIKSQDVNVRYRGILSAENLCALEQDMSVYVHPTYIDNSPNSVCEAQLLGLPVIATNVGGIPTLVSHNETGFLVPTNAPYDLAYRIIWIHENPDIVTEMALEGVKVAAKRHDRERIKNDLLNVYKNILGNEKNRSSTNCFQQKG